LGIVGADEELKRSIPSDLGWMDELIRPPRAWISCRRLVLCLTEILFLMGSGNSTTRSLGRQLATSPPSSPFTTAGLGAAVSYSVRGNEEGVGVFSARFNYSIRLSHREGHLFGGRCIVRRENLVGNTLSIFFGGKLMFHVS